MRRYGLLFRHATLQMLLTICSNSCDARCMHTHGSWLVDVASSTVIAPVHGSKAGLAANHWWVGAWRARGGIVHAQAVVRGISPGGDESHGSGDSEQERAPARGGRGSRGGGAKTGAANRRRASTAQEPGPPVEGALVRIDAWPLDGPDGQSLSRSVPLYAAMLHMHSLPQPGALQGFSHCSVSACPLALLHSLTGDATQTLFHSHILAPHPFRPTLVPRLAVQQVS